MKKLKIAVSQFNNITYDIEDELSKRGHKVEYRIRNTADLKTFDVLVAWNEVHQYGNHEVIKKANRMGLHTVLLQHGRRGTSRIFPPFNEELISKVTCSWSENDKKRLMLVGTDERRIEVTGTPLFKHLKPRVPHDGFNVVFSPEHWGVEVVENNIVMGTLRRLKGAKIYTKVLSDSHNIAQYDNPIVSDRNAPNHMEIVANTLAMADAVVCISESTFELFAQSLDIPVIHADIWQPKECMGDPRYKEYRREVSNACVSVQDMNKLNDAITFALKNPEHLREERKQIAIDDGGIDIPNPTERIVDVIEDVKRPWI